MALYVHALRERTIAYINENCTDLVEQIKENDEDIPSPQCLDHWWASRQRWYPSKEEDENLFILAERSHSFGESARAQAFFEKWLQVEPESIKKWSTMRHWYSDLGNYTSAAEAQRRVLEKSTTAWDRASSCEQLIDLYTKSSAFSSALEIVSMLDAIFSKTNEWNSIGLFRFSIFNTFSLTIAHPDDEAARAAFLLADAWARRCPNLSESDLNHGAKAAARCGFKDHYRRYTALAEDESWSLCALRQGRHALETASAWVVKKQTLAEK